MNTIASTTEEKEQKKDEELQEVLTPEEQKNLPLYEEMMKAGVVYGRKKSKLHPKMHVNIYTTRNNVALFDLAQVVLALDRALVFLKSAVEGNKKILFVATQPAMRDMVRELAKRFNEYEVTERWLGGTLTNFKTISGRIEHFRNLKSDRAAGRHEQYTKKERLLIDREIEKLRSFFSGIEEMRGLPDVMVVVNPVVHETAVREAKRMKIPVVAIANSDADPGAANYCIPANTSARTSVAWVLERVAKAIESGKSIAASRVAVAPDVTKK